MPLIDPNLAATWANSYDGGYTRSNTRLVELVKQDAREMAGLLGLQPGQKIVLFGAGFAWEAEELQVMGLGPICCVDFSTWIQANKSGNATVTILDEDGGTAQSQRNIKTALGVTGNDKADWAISMDMAPWLTDAECTKYAEAMRSLATQCAHVISIAEVNKPPVGNWHSLEEWKSLLTPDIVIERGGNRQML